MKEKGWVENIVQVNDYIYYNSRNYLKENKLTNKKN